MRSSQLGTAPTQRLRGQRGASAVEFAIVTPLLISLLFGIVDFGIVLHDYGALREGTRAGARQGAVALFGSNSSCAIVGTVASTEARKLICLTKDRVDSAATPESKLRIKIVLGSAGYKVGEPMRICAQAPMESTSGVFSPFMKDGVLTATVTMRIEQRSSGDFAAAEEDPLPAKAWSCPAP